MLALSCVLNESSAYDTNRLKNLVCLSHLSYCAEEKDDDTVQGHSQCVHKVSIMSLIKS
jgi:hypothetical protein